MKHLITCLRILFFTLLICCIIYPLVVLAIGQLVTPHTANGSLIVNKEGVIVGSEQIAQSFTQTDYFWPRPSAVNYNGAGAGGSNWSPANPALKERAQKSVADFGTDRNHLLPADLAAASGSGLDPHITYAAAIYQIPRIAQARGVKENVIQNIVDKLAFAPGGILTSAKIVNVLLLNLKLDSDLHKS